MSATSNIHSFHVLTREVSPVGNKTTTTIRRKISRGKSKPGTTPIRNINPETGLVIEEKIEQNKVQFNPGEMEEETIQGATIRWTMNHNGKDHVVVDTITYKELQILKSVASGATAYNSIGAVIIVSDVKDTVVTQDIEIADFKTLILKANTNSPLFHLTDVVYLDSYALSELKANVEAYTAARLPSGVTI